MERDQGQGAGQRYVEGWPRGLYDLVQRDHPEVWAEIANMPVYAGFQRLAALGVITMPENDGIPTAADYLDGNGLASGTLWSKKRNEPRRSAKL